MLSPEKFNQRQTKMRGVGVYFSASATTVTLDKEQSKGRDAAPNLACFFSRRGRLTQRGGLKKLEGADGSRFLRKVSRTLCTLRDLKLPRRKHQVTGGAYITTLLPIYIMFGVSYRRTKSISRVYDLNSQLATHNRGQLRHTA